MSGQSYTAPEAAAILGRSTGTLANWRSAGKGPPWLKIGGPVSYPQREFDEWRARHMQPGAPVHRARKSRAQGARQNCAPSLGGTDTPTPGLEIS